MQLAADGLIKARWTDAIHDEWMRNLASVVPIERLVKTKRLMEVALPGASVSGYQRHIDSIELPDADDRHVVAAGIECGASTIVTWNVRDFPLSQLEGFGLKCQNPDDFLVELYDRKRDAVLGSLASARRNLSKTLISPTDFIETLAAQRLGGLAQRLGRRVDRL